MKKLLSSILATTLFVSLATVAFANDNTSDIYIPTPEEIHLQYQQMSKTQDEAISQLNNIDMENKPLLQLGILSSYAEQYNDLTVLHAASELAHTELIPHLTSDDYIAILSNANYDDAFKFSVMDMYSYSTESLNMRNTSLVDNELINFIVPNGELTVDAIASIKDKSIIDAEQLASLIKTGSVAEQKVALRTLSEEYPDVAYSYINDILSNEAEDAALYTAAINFIPQIVDKSDTLTENEALNIIGEILAHTENNLVQITCVQALQELNSAEAANVLSENSSIVSTELLEYYNQYSDFDVVNTTTNSISPYASSNRLANAIYRGGVALGIEWHAGIVAHSQGPEYNDTGEWIIHASGASGSIVEYATYEDFLDNNNNTGEHWMSSMDYSDQVNIFFTAVDLTNDSIPYTVFSIFTTDVNSGTIEPSDIKKMRCDGVVEYSYEYNGIRVLGTNDHWNCSTPEGRDEHASRAWMPRNQAYKFDKEF